MQWGPALQKGWSVCPSGSAGWLCCPVGAGQGDGGPAKPLGSAVVLCSKGSAGVPQAGGDFWCIPAHVARFLQFDLRKGRTVALLLLPISRDLVLW